MNFFYDAIQRETGTEAPKRRRADQEAGQPVAADGGNAAAVAMAEMDVADAGPLDAAYAKLTLPNRLEKLVAVLAPPVVGNNVSAMEKTRVIRTKLVDLAKKKNLRTFLMTSAMPADGKTLVSTNLAFALSHLQDYKVLLIDADLRRPSLKTFLQVEVEHGLGTYLNGRSSLESTIRQISPSLCVLPTEPLDGDHPELLQGSRMRSLLAFARENFNIVLLDSPPLFPIADTQVLLNLVDAAILVARAGQTPSKLVEESARVLGNKLAGTVLNGASSSDKSDYYYGYGHGYGRSAAKK